MGRVLAEGIASTQTRAMGSSSPTSAIVALCFGAIAAVAALFVQDWEVRLLILAVGLALVMGSFLASFGASGLGFSKRGRQVEQLIRNDAAAQLLTDQKGTVLIQNPASIEIHGDLVRKPISEAFGALFANPEAVVFRLKMRARQDGFGEETTNSAGAAVRLSAISTGKKRLLWRVENLLIPELVENAQAILEIPTVIAAPSGQFRDPNPAFLRELGGRYRDVGHLFGKAKIQDGEVFELKTLQGEKSFQLAVVPAGEDGELLKLLPDSSDQSSVPGGLSVDDLPVPAMSIDAQGRLIDANSSARALLDLDVSVGGFVSELFEGLGRSVSEWLAEISKAKGVARPEVLKVRHPDKDVFLQVSVTALPALKGQDTGNLLAILNDATELKSLEAQFVQSQKMQAIGQLAGGVAHDFNNLLTAISGHCDLLLMKYDKGDPEYSDLVQIHQNANRAASLVGQLLAFSRKQNLQLENLDLRETLSDLTHLLNRLVGEKVALSLRHEPDLPILRADKRQLEQVLMNLVVNARDAMPDGGAITIETSIETLATETTRQRAKVPAGEYIVVKVADQGIGIASDKLPKIFEPFYTTKRMGEGTGLGLSTAYGIVKQSGGFIFVDSEIGKGTEFSLYFPVHKVTAAPAVSSAKTLQDRAVKAAEGVILLVEDEAPVRAFASRALRMCGYQVLEADSAEQALETLQDEDLDVDVFVSDVIMPGMDGPTWVREALRNRPDTRVIFVSGYAEESITDNQSRIPNSVFLPKPFSLSELTNTVMEQTA